MKVATGIQLSLVTDDDSYLSNTGAEFLFEALTEPGACVILAGGQEGNRPSTSSGRTDAGKMPALQACTYQIDTDSRARRVLVRCSSATYPVLSQH